MVRRCVNPWLAVWCAAAGVAVGRGEAREFDFKDPKGVNAMTFLLDSPVEPIVGVASGVSGKVFFDADKPEQLRGRLAVEAASLHVPNARVQEHLHSADWLDVQKYAEISLTIKEVRQARKVADNTFELQVAGDFTCHGVTRPIAITVKATSLPGKLGDRVRGASGDLLVLRAEFSVKRSEFSIKPDIPATAVADEIQIRAGIVGMWTRK